MWIKNLSLFMIATSICVASYCLYLKTKGLQNFSKPEVHDYKVVQISSFRRDQFLIDSKTGKIWTKICMGEVDGADCNGEEIWKDMTVVGINGYTNEDFNKYVHYLSELKKDKAEALSKPKNK